MSSTVSGAEPGADAGRLPPPSAPDAADPPLAVRAQLLATEHWSLLATRSMTWSEVMGRISIHLTVSSASLVVLALVAQASGFGTPFRVLSIGLASAILLLGTLTAMRVSNASDDDAAMVVGMNRLRAAYTEIDPAIARYLITSRYDDQAGLMATYRMGRPRGTLSHVLASTSMFIIVVNAIVAGTLAALVADAAGGGVPLVAVAGAVSGLAYLGAWLAFGQRRFSGARFEVRFPSDPPPAGER
jgi:hypothetical protein